jgi:cytoskeleton protein RodZ
MEPTQNDNLVEEQVAPKKMGEILREARLQKSLSVADVAAQIRLAPRQIEALEADDLAQLPELPFVRGFVRSYAKLLQIDAAPLLEALPETQKMSERIEPLSVDVPFNIKHLSKQQNQIWLIASAVLLVIALIFAVWHFNTPKTVSSESPALVELTIPLPDPVSSVVTANSESLVESKIETVDTPALPAKVMPIVPTASGVTAASAVPSTSGKLHLAFEGESWTKITDSTGQVLSSQLNLAGSELNLAGVAPYELIIGNAKAVRLYRRGKSVDLTSHINPSNEVARLTLE